MLMMTHVFKIASVLFVGLYAALFSITSIVWGIKSSSPNRINSITIIDDENNSSEAGIAQNDYPGDNSILDA